MKEMITMRVCNECGPVYGMGGLWDSLKLNEETHTTHHVDLCASCYYHEWGVFPWEHFSRFQDPSDPHLYA